MFRTGPYDKLKHALKKSILKKRKVGSYRVQEGQRILHKNPMCQFRVVEQPGIIHFELLKGYEVGKTIALFGKNGMKEIRDNTLLSQKLEECKIKLDI